PLLSDVKKRNQTLVEAEELLLAEAPIAPIYQKGEAHLTNPQVKNLQYHNIGGDTAYIDKSIDRETGKKKEK
ncbi:peptide ABC transporter substrate-binding protein, partial [Staphylococcus pseudintermedius]